MHRRFTGRFMTAVFLAGIVLLSLPAASAPPTSQTKKSTTALPNPILFVGQVPLPGDFTSVASAFGNQIASESLAPRGGDLFIRYPDGTVKNVTRAAGFGNSGFQGANSIAVREPCVHWSGTKAVFSMVVGAPTQQFQVASFFWQLYEVANLGENETPVVTKVPNQPAGFNNVSPVYGTDGRILFTSDRPRTGQAHLYPQLDEYEEAPTVSGVWSLDPATGDLRMLDHTPSGAFTPSIDSFGRVVFTRWDHLQRDQQADADADVPGTFGTFDFSDESAAAQKLNQRVELFPEPRSGALPPGTNLVGNSFNQFFPWAMNEDGTSEEPINHVGRHEFHSFFDRVFTDDPFIQEFISVNSGRFNTNEIENTLQLREDPLNPGLYYATDSPEFKSHASGQLLSFSAPPSKPADQIQVNWITPRSTRDFADPPAPPDDSGHYRDPLPLSDGTLLAVHTPETREDFDNGPDSHHPLSVYDFRIKTMVRQPNGFYLPAATVTSGIPATISYWDPDQSIQFSGNLWELSPVEVRPRAIPTRATTPLDPPEVTAFAQANVDVQQFRQYLAANNLALIVSRNVTTRDGADRQQPFNLRVPQGASHIVDASKKIYDISTLQLYQADQLRGVGGTPDPANPALVTGGKEGRRVLARKMHDPSAQAANPPATVSATGTVKIALDGSIAAFVPARRAMSWHLSDPANTPVVRERYWLTFQPGEVRVCASCHGINSRDQLNQTPPQNTPAALIALLQAWKATQCSGPPAISTQPASLTVPAGTGATLSVGVPGTGLTYQWYAGASGVTASPINGATGSSVNVTPAATASYWVRVTTSCGSTDSATATVTVQPITGASFYLIAPCRVLDTRGGGALSPNAARNLVVTGKCGVPVGATSLAINVTVVSPPVSGLVTLYPGPANTVKPVGSTINYSAARTLANNARITIGTDGSINMFNAAGSPLDFLIDISGYFK